MLEEKDRRDQFSSSYPILPGVDRAESPNKRMRNMKNLSVNTSASNRQGPALPKLSLSNSSGANHAFSAPPTPAFIVPPKVPRRTPSNLGLTITTPEATSVTEPVQGRPSAVPFTPSDNQIRTLRALQTSSNGPLNSPTVAPEGGMRLPPFSNSFASGRFAKSRPPISFSPPPSFDSSISSPITKQTLEHVQEETDYELPLSQEVKSPAYPQGPVCIYEPSVYLYLEPSHTEAREFDVVLNVAREVKNPFNSAAEEIAADRMQEETLPGALETHMPRLAGRDSNSEPQTANSEMTFDSALQEQLDDATRSAPSTPKAWKPEPEYIHIPWDHNTNVVDDLLRLCELIDNRVRHDKRVLVHCQCGVSRSASLVVAYGLYRNPQLTVQEAYDAVKNRSRWIGPNMNLIYQLSEFKSKLSKPQHIGIPAWHSWRTLAPGRSHTSSLLDAELRHSPPSSLARFPPQKSLSDPSKPGREPQVARSNSFSPPCSAQLAPVAIGDISPGPSSAPPDMQWSPGQVPANPKEDSKVAINQDEANEAMPSRLENVTKLMDVDAYIVPSPTTMEREGIEATGKPPAGGITKDLQEIAKDLGNHDLWSTKLSTPKSVDEASKEHILALSATGIVSNIDEAAKDLENHEPRSTRLSPQKAVEEAKKEHVSAPPAVVTVLNMHTVVHSSTALASPNIEDTQMDGTASPALLIPAAQRTEIAPKPPGLRPMPSLPAGFSSLLSRRQGPLSQRQLPLRPSLPRLISTQSPPIRFDPEELPTPLLVSPRAAEFTASPFHRTAAGDLAGSSIFEQGLMSPRAVENDPRSPHQKGEAPITRSIFDMI